jgi:hypothetical protein
MISTEKKFYNLFWNNPTCQNIFPNHKALLLEDEVAPNVIVIGSSGVIFTFC